MFRLVASCRGQGRQGQRTSKASATRQNAVDFVCLLAKLRWSRAPRWLLGALFIRMSQSHNIHDGKSDGRMWVKGLSRGCFRPPGGIRRIHRPEIRAPLSPPTLNDRAPCEGGLFAFGVTNLSQTGTQHNFFHTY